MIYNRKKSDNVHPVTNEAGGRPVKASLQAYNPAQRAQENQEVLVGSKLLQILASIFPQTLQVIVDDVATAAAFKAKLGDKLVKFRDSIGIKEALSRVAQLVGLGGPKPPGGITGGQ